MSPDEMRVKIAEKYGRLTFLREGGRNRSKNILWVCRCDCGSEKTVPKTDVVRGHTLSCGCLRRDNTVAMRTTHGHASRRSKHKSYQTWSGMHGRCSNPRSPEWKNYGGRGITVCEEWGDFARFVADMGEKPDGKSLDRIDNNGPYAPWNCRWATHKEQSANRRTNRVVELDGVQMILSEACKKTGTNYAAAIWRMDNNKDWRTPIRAARRSCEP